MLTVQFNGKRLPPIFRRLANGFPPSATSPLQPSFSTGFPPPDRWKKSWRNRYLVRTSGPDHHSTVPLVQFAGPAIVPFFSFLSCEADFRMPYSLIQLTYPQGPYYLYKSRVKYGKWIRISIFPYFYRIWGSHKPSQPTRTSKPLESGRFPDREKTFVPVRDMVLDTSRFTSIFLRPWVFFAIKNIKFIFDIKLCASDMMDTQCSKSSNVYSHAT